ncbi:uncharacterized protein LOC131147724 isoform X2 [Malania oleifera]|uniref:uncharacterized protein LOC131147724 isoform X2 n=1 Tax=Malania oleifera TaxID=397392 RepID=UPI0025ADDEC4|nr:uncharacterized protein LOC131147724 isoform X2 [Malania oleifera]
MEKVKAFLEVTEEESETVSRVAVRPHRVGHETSFYDDFALRGIRVLQARPGFALCSFKIPPRLTNRKGELASGAIATLVDAAGASVLPVVGPGNVSVDISISYLSAAKLHGNCGSTDKDCTFCSDQSRLLHK